MDKKPLIPQSIWLGDKKRYIGENPILQRSALNRREVIFMPHNFSALKIHDKGAG